MNYAGIPDEYAELDSAKIVLIPVPYDGTSTWIKGANKGPEAFLEASENMEMENIPFWSYFCQISDSTTSYGSYSGAVPNEKITWGKLDIDTPKFIVESDATIVAPLIFAWLLNW